MSLELEEGGLRFSFSDNVTISRPDKEERTLKASDLLVQTDHSNLLIEIKDPDGAKKNTIIERKKALAEIRNFDIAKSQLLPKLYGSYVYLHETGIDMEKPIRFAVIFGLSNLDAAERSALTDRLQRTTIHIGPVGGKNRVSPIIEIHNLESWSAAHPDIRISRL